MKRKSFVAVPFIAMPIFLPIYKILDNLIFVEVFGCGCVSTFNANDLQRVVFTTLTILLTIFAIYIAKALKGIIAKIAYCVVAFLLNLLLSNWVINTLIWK